MLLAMGDSSSCECPGSRRKKKDGPRYRPGHSLHLTQARNRPINCKATLFQRSNSSHEDTCTQRRSDEHLHLHIAKKKLNCLTQLMPSAPGHETSRSPMDGPQMSPMKVNHCTGLHVIPPARPSPLIACCSLVGSVDSQVNCEMRRRSSHPEGNDRCTDDRSVESLGMFIGCQLLGLQITQGGDHQMILIILRDGFSAECI